MLIRWRKERWLHEPDRRQAHLLGQRAQGLANLGGLLALRLILDGFDGLVCHGKRWMRVPATIWAIR